jgi:septum formation protein
MHPRLILASSSSRRLELLNQIGFTPDLVIPADVDETPLKLEKPDKLALRLAKAKAEKISTNFPDDVILAADTVAYCRRQLLGKPENEAQAAEFLHMLSGRRHRVYTGMVACLGSRKIIKVCCTLVKIKRITNEEIAEFVESRAWEGKAGGYSIHGKGATLIEYIRGSDSNVAGLPLHFTNNILRSFGVKPIIN